MTATSPGRPGRTYSEIFAIQQDGLLEPGAPITFVDIDGAPFLTVYPDGAITIDLSTVAPASKDQTLDNIRNLLQIDEAILGRGWSAIGAHWKWLPFSRRLDVDANGDAHADPEQPSIVSE